MRSTLNITPSNASSIVLACCVLHNFLRSKRCNQYCPTGFADTVDMNGQIIEGAWRQDDANHMRDVRPTANRNAPATAASVRETFINYLSNEGALVWQIEHVNRV